MLSEDELDRLCPLPPPPGALPRVLDHATAVALGYSPQAIWRAVRSGRWRRILPRVYLTVETLGPYDRCVAALAHAGVGAAVSGAAALWLSDVRQAPAPVSLLVRVPHENCSKSSRWVRVRRTERPFAVQLAPGPRRTSIALATADRAVELRRVDDVRALVARVVQDGHCTLDDLEAEYRAGPRRWSAHLRTALEEVGWGAASAPEARAARILREGGISGFVQNAVIDLPDGSTRIVDFYWPRLRACLEIDSVEWHFGAVAWTRTLDRHLALTSLGYSVIHRPPSALYDRQRFVRDIAAWLAGREAELRRGLPDDA